MNRKTMDIDIYGGRKPPHNMKIRITTQGSGNLNPGEAYLDDLLKQSGATRSGNTLTLTTGGITQSGSVNIKYVNGREVVNVEEFGNTLVSPAVLAQRLSDLVAFILKFFGSIGVLSADNNTVLNSVYGSVYSSVENNGFSVMSTGIKINQAVLDSYDKPSQNDYNVSNIQNALVKAGYWIEPDGSTSNAKVDGYYGPQTRASIIKFQLYKMGLSPKDIFYEGKVPDWSSIYKDPYGSHVGVGPKTALELSNYITQGTGNSDAPGTVSGNKIGYKSIDFYNMPQSYKDSYNQLMNSIMNAKDDTELSIYTQMLQTWLDNMSSSYGQLISKTVYYTSGVGGGILQGIGGGTEAATGWAVATGGSVLTAGLASEVAIPFGGYMMADGGCNFAEGAQKVVDTFRHNTTESKDSWNLIKRGLVNLSPDYGDDIYNLTQIGIGAFNVAGDIAAIPSTCGKTATWGSNIRNAKTWGCKTQTQLVECAGFLILETKTENGMMLQMTVLDGTKLAAQGFVIVNDGYSTVNGASSIAN